MNKIIITTLAFLTSACVIVLPYEAQGKGSIDIGYKVEDSNTKNLNVHQKWNWEPKDKDFQVETETNVYKTEVNGEKLTDRSDGEYEFILNFTPKWYGIANFGFNYNANRDIGDFRPHSGAGVGWKFFRTERWKMSHELTLTQMGTEEYSELVWRNSTWIRYKHPDSKWSFTNKYLWENGSNVHELTKNEMIVSYQLSTNTTFKVRDLYITDDAEEEYSVSYITLGYKF